jgi:hypothetical protein
MDPDKTKKDLVEVRSDLTPDAQNFPCQQIKIRLPAAVVGDRDPQTIPAF